MIIDVTIGSHARITNFIVAEDDCCNQLVPNRFPPLPSPAPCAEGSEDLPTTDLVVGTPSMSAIGRHLAERCRSLEVHVDRTAQVQGRRKMTGQWCLRLKVREGKREILRKTMGCWDVFGGCFFFGESVGPHGTGLVGNIKT